MHNSGASRRGARRRVCCLTIESSYVVPAKAGTRSHRRSLLWKVSNSVPQRDGTAYGSLLSQGRRKGADALPSLREATCPALLNEPGRKRRSNPLSASLDRTQRDYPHTVIALES